MFECAKFIKEGQRGAKVLILLSPHYITSQNIANIATMVPLEMR